MPGAIGAPDLTAGQGIPGPGGGGGGGGSSAPPLAADVPVLLWSADGRATAGVVFGGPFVVTSTGVPPTDVRYLWLDTQSGTGIPKYYDTTSSTWLTLIGAAGTSVYRWGSGAPGSGLGANGDLYIDTASGDMYAKSGGAWSLVVNLIGPPGASLNPTGAWNIATSYNPLDTVSSGGSSYIAISANTGTDPATHPLVWQLLAAGADGQALCSALDTTPDYLSSKLAASGYWTWTIINGGSNETLQIGFATQSANTVLAAPSGSAGVPGFRVLVAADIPSLDAAKITTGTIATARLAVFGASGGGHTAGIVPDPGSTAGTTKYLREDGTWSVPPGTGGGSATLPTDYISGCALSWVSATQVRIGTGTCYVPVGSAAVTVASAITLTPSLSSSTVYCVYLTNATTAVVSTSSPSTNYAGTAWEDAFGNRYIGTFVTDSTGAIVRFEKSGNRYFYRNDVVTSSFANVVSGGTGSGTFFSGGFSTGTVSIVSFLVKLTNTSGSTLTANFGSSTSVTASSTVGAVSLACPPNSSVSAVVDLPVNAIRSGTYYAPTNLSISMTVVGYLEAR